jgi:hypothetical protein
MAREIRACKVAVRIFPPLKRKGRDDVSFRLTAFRPLRPAPCASLCYTVPGSTHKRSTPSRLGHVLHGRIAALVQRHVDLELRPRDIAR